MPCFVVTASTCGKYSTLGGIGAGAYAIAVLAGALASVEIRAVNAVGAGPWSAAKTALPSCPTSRICSNAALRAINLGYKQVLWYRGGIEAWQKAGLQTFGREG